MNYEINKNCRFCESNLKDVIFLGDSFPLAGGFMRNKQEFAREQTYPLTLSFCENCILLQCKEVINSDLLFKNGYFYYSSMIPMLKDHFDGYADQLSKLYKNPRDITVIEIGCNDGVFLYPLKEKGFKVIGVDPSDTVKNCKDLDIKIYNDYFNETLADKILEEHGKVDLFLSSNSFAHINNMKSIMKGIKKILKIDGLTIIEVHYSKTILDELQFDFIYHEHMTYYFVTSFYNIAKIFDMTLEDVEKTNIHGSSIKVYLRNNINRKESDKILKMMEEEKLLCNIRTYVEFNKSLKKWKEEMMNILKIYRGKKIYGYGSSGRSNMILKYLDLKLDEIIDDADSKIGTYTPIYHLCIKSSQQIIIGKPDVIIILAWPYTDYIIGKLKNYYHGDFIIPLPHIRVIKKNDLN